MLADADAIATVAVKSLEVSRPFYEEVLGLECVQGMEGVRTYRTGRVTLLVYESENAGTNEATSVTFALGERFDAIAAALKAKGVRFEAYDMPGATPDADNVYSGHGMRVAWFKDPDGAVFCIGDF